MQQWSLMIHGGAGAIARGGLTAAQDAAYRAALARIAEDAGRLLAAGGTALDAVEAAVRGLEDDPLFNAGRGAVFTADGRNALDAAIMDGETRAAGAVTGVIGIANPISLARAVMERSPHVMLASAGAEAFARSLGIVFQSPAYFFNASRWRALEEFLAAHDLPLPLRPVQAEAPSLAHDEGTRGTVGAVARDGRGHVAAATSTGGITGKRWDRVGDSPVIGAGCYAHRCAVSCTGSGEVFLRIVAAHAVAARVDLSGKTPDAAIAEVLAAVAELGGEGGIIALTADGRDGWGFNTAGMNRANQ